MRNSRSLSPVVASNSRVFGSRLAGFVKACRKSLSGSSVLRGWMRARGAPGCPRTAPTSRRAPCCSRESGPGAETKAQRRDLTTQNPAPEETRTKTRLNRGNEWCISTHQVDTGTGLLASVAGVESSRGTGSSYGECFDGISGGNVTESQRLFVEIQLRCNERRFGGGG